MELSQWGVLPERLLTGHRFGADALPTRICVATHVTTRVRYKVLPDCFIRDFDTRKCIVLSMKGTGSSGQTALFGKDVR